MASAGVQAEPIKPVDLNRATVEQLTDLPGIGAAKAAAIVAHRSSSGVFESVEDLEAVRGIGPALVDKLRPLVTLGRRDGSKSRPKAAGPGRSASAK